MSIKKKLSIFVLVLLLVPMLLLVLSTQHFFDRQIQENERNYLQVAMKTVRNDMENRMDEMRKAGSQVIQILIKPCMMIETDLLWL